MKTKSNIVKNTAVNRLNIYFNKRFIILFNNLMNIVYVFI